MTRASTKEQADDVRQYVMDQLVDQEWVKKVVLDTDDCGWMVAVKVDSQKYKTSGHKIPSSVNEVKVVVLLM